MSDKICVGRLAGAFGVRGEVRLKSFCAEPEAIVDYAPLVSADGREFRQIVLTGQGSGAYTARIDGITTKEEADALKGCDLFAPRDRLPALPDDEYYHADLIGLAVHDTGGALLGTVRDVLNHGAGDLLEVAPPGGGETVLLPFTLAAVPTVDLASGRIVADPPEGLFAG
ncbi:ribosome maturation factor RimM [Limimaricola cinnabarinus]|jgi:16S rRNA processing protein RimM|uniref:Ribosome maturation factor RimM n=1 Tax=Limimaricola cinnabarinus TaxID=1125964 RepID=A0A2G1MIE2_9RHOB|nr:ribosome maturation factor RimM [Limimaricola cinnabarinus]PHP28521.1 16S rRNA processing protein RimM [Limimaricola cinnabarinus]